MSGHLTAKPTSSIAGFGRRLGLWCAALAITSMAFAGTYYVATTGVDTNAGTSTNAPWRTIQKAANTLAPGDAVFVRGGIYNQAINSPAVNSGGPNFESLTNQTGETDLDLQSRTALGRTDIGADELNLLSAMLGISSAANRQLQSRLAGEPGHPLVWEQSATLSGWSTILTNYADSAGRMFFTSSVAAGSVLSRKDDAVIFSD